LCSALARTPRSSCCVAGGSAAYRVPRALIGGDPDLLVHRVKFLAAETQLVNESADLAERGRMELWPLPTEFKRRRPRASVGPLERQRRRAAIGEPYDDAVAAALAQQAQHAERLAREWVEGMGDDRQFRRWSDPRWGFLK